MFTLTRFGWPSSNEAVATLPLIRGCRFGEAGLYERHIGSIEHVGGINQDEFKQMNRALQRLDRFWNDTIAYRM